MMVLCFAPNREYRSAERILFSAALLAGGCGDSAGDGDGWEIAGDDGWEAAGDDDSNNDGSAGDDAGSAADDEVPVQAGCYVPAYGASQTSAIGCGLLPSFGDAQFDASFAQEVVIQSSFWGLSPTVYAFNECPNVRNALSLPAGVILFGYNLTVSTIIETGSTLPLAGALAHEWAHQLQFTFGWMNTGEPTVRTTELEADAFSGFYLGVVKGWAGSQLDAYFQTLFNLGDYNFNDQGHHGTPDERVAAGALGLMVANDVLSSGMQPSYDELHQIFRSAISSALLEPSSPGDLGAAAPELIEAVAEIASGVRSVRSVPAHPASAARRALLSPRMPAAKPEGGAP